MSFLIVVWELDSSYTLNSTDNSIKPELCQSDLKHFIIFNYSFYVYVYTHHSVCVEVRDKLGESILSFHSVGLRGQIWIVRLGSQYLYSLSHPTGPIRNNSLKLLKDNKIRELNQRNCLGM